MKTLILLTIVFVQICTAATNTNQVAQLNAHERFYVNYRAQKARLEKAVHDLEQVRARQKLEDAKKVEAGITTALSPIVQYGNRIEALKKEIAKLDLARLDYEKRYPDASRYAQSPPVVARPEPPRQQPAQRVIIQRDPSERILTPNQQAGAYVAPR